MMRVRCLHPSTRLSLYCRITQGQRDGAPSHDGVKASPGIRTVAMGKPLRAKVPVHGPGVSSRSVEPKAKRQKLMLSGSVIIATSLVPIISAVRIGDRERKNVAQFDPNQL